MRCETQLRPWDPSVGWMRPQDIQFCVSNALHIQSHQDKNSQVRKYDLRVDLEPSVEKGNLTMMKPYSHCVCPHLFLSLGT